MEIKILCDKCFEDVIKKGHFHKYGSVTYCNDCKVQIERELLQDYLCEKIKERKKMIANEQNSWILLGKEA